MTGPGDREAEDRLLLPTFARWPFSIVKGERVHVWDESGRRYLDLYGGHAVASTGHCHPRIVSRLVQAAGDLLFYSTTAYHPARLEAAERLLSHAPRGVSRIFFTNSGAEANEAAMKLARKSTGRSGIVSFEGAFHGRTQGALSATGIERYRKGAGPLVPGHQILPWADLPSLERIDSGVAAVILEPIQSMAGVREAPLAWYAALRGRANEVGALLIFDEIQTGMGRTGHFYSHPWTGIDPDLVTLAKGIASGFPLSATLVRDRVAEGLAVGDFGSTFGGGPLATALAAETVRVIEDEGLASRASSLERLIREEVSRLARVREVRGRGLLLGLALDGFPANQAVRAFQEAGILVGTSSDPSVLRLLPPLVLGEEDLVPFFDAARRILS